MDINALSFKKIVTDYQIKNYLDVHGNKKDRRIIEKYQYNMNIAYALMVTYIVNASMVLEKSLEIGAFDETSNLIVPIKWCSIKEKRIEVAKKAIEIQLPNDSLKRPHSIGENFLLFTETDNPVCLDDLNCLFEVFESAGFKCMVTDDVTMENYIYPIY